MWVCVTELFRRRRLWVDFAYIPNGHIKCFNNDWFRARLQHQNRIQTVVNAQDFLLEVLSLLPSVKLHFTFHRTPSHSVGDAKTSHNGCNVQKRQEDSKYKVVGYNIWFSEQNFISIKRLIGNIKSKYQIKKSEHNHIEPSEARGWRIFDWDNNMTTENIWPNDFYSAFITLHKQSIRDTLLFSSIYHCSLIRFVTLPVLEYCEVTFDDIGFENAYYEDDLSTVNEGDRLEPGRTIRVGDCKIW